MTDNDDKNVSADMTTVQQPPQTDSYETTERIQKFREKLLDLATWFIDISSREIVKEINRSLRHVGEYWAFDRVILAELNNNGTNARVMYSYTAPGILQHFPIIELHKAPPLAAKIQKGEVVIITPTQKKSSKTITPGENLIAKGLIQPGIFIPIQTEGVYWGVLYIDSRRAKNWPCELIEQLRHLNRILTGALDRWRAAEQLREIEQFEHLLSEISAIYINLPAIELEKVLKKDFARLNKALGVDVSILYVTGEGSPSFHLAKPLIWFLDENQESNKPLLEWLQQNPTINSDMFKYLFRKWNLGESTPWQLTEEVPGEGSGERQASIERNIKSALAVPIKFAGSVKGVINIATTNAFKNFPEELIPRLRLLGEVFINALMRKQSEEKLQRALTEIKGLKKRIEADYFYLREEIDFAIERDFSDIVGKSDALKKILLKVKQVAPTHASVLLLGETGTGKGLIARAIHNASKRRDRPLMQINCAALAPGIIESELFGHEKGAFTGALIQRTGRFEAARGTTLFLDEIGELPLEQQPKLLRALEEGEFERVGGSTTFHTDARVIAATSRDLEKEVALGKFRQDLWYRLNIFPIFIPPLRNRLEDIPLFVAYFVDKYSKWAGKKFEKVSLETIQALQNYSWPGNIRELRNTIERAVITSPEGHLQIESPKINHNFQSDPRTVKDAASRAKREQILGALQKCGWVIEGPNGAGKLLGISGSNIRYYVRKYNIKRPT
jgi:formate hydrogenlyase transcriptional activator